MCGDTGAHMLSLSATNKTVALETGDILSKYTKTRISRNHDFRKNVFCRDTAEQPWPQRSSDMELQGLEIIESPTKEKLNERESSWMWNLGSHRVQEGLNIDEPFFKDLKFST